MSHALLHKKRLIALKLTVDSLFELKSNIDLAAKAKVQTIFLQKLLRPCMAGPYSQKTPKKLVRKIQISF